MVKIVKCALAAVLASLPAAAFAAWELNMPVGVTELSRRIHAPAHADPVGLRGIAIVVFGVMIYSIVKFRQLAGRGRRPTFDHSTRVEIVWTVIPIVILVAMAVPAAATLVRIEDTRNSDLTIKVTGYQWSWHYEYLDATSSFFSSLARDSDAARQLGSGIDPKSVPNYLLDVDNPLVVPAGKKVRFLLTAGDVIHAWWVPAFGMKKDAIPGLRQRDVVPTPTRSASIAASAPSCAAAITASCPSSSKSARRPTSTAG